MVPDPWLLGPVAWFLLPFWVRLLFSLAIRLQHNAASLSYNYGHFSVLTYHEVCLMGVTFHS